MQLLELILVIILQRPHNLFLYLLLHQVVHLLLLLDLQPIPLRVLATARMSDSVPNRRNQHHHIVNHYHLSSNHNRSKSDHLRRRLRQA